MVQRIYDKLGKRVWYDGVLEGNCPECGQSLNNVALDVHSCTPPRKQVVFRHTMSGRKQFGGIPMQETFCADCGKIWNYCQCPPPPSALIRTETGELIPSPNPH